MRNPQLNRQGELNHLLTTEGLPPRILNRVLELAEYDLVTPEAVTRAAAPLSGRRVFSLFFQQSTHARQAFEAAARRLSAEMVHIEVASTVLENSDGLVEAIAGLEASPGDLLVLRHPQSGAPYLVSQHLAPAMHVINAGDGDHADPIQALVNVYAIRHVKKELANLTVALVGDVLHSRVARSTIHALTTLCVAEVRVVGPLTLIPKGLEQMGVRVFTTMHEGLRDADVVIVLPTDHAHVPASLQLSAQDYFAREQLNQETLAHAKSDCFVMDAETTGQVGIAIRMAALRLIAESQP